MRTGARIALIVVIAIVVFAVLVIATPVGWRVGMPLARRAVRQRTGLELSAASMSGSPLSRLVLSDVSLDDPEQGDPDAGPLFSASSLTVHYDLLSLRRGAPVIHELAVDGAVVTLDVGGDGALAGWGRFASGDTTVVVDEGEPMEWMLEEARLTDVTVRYSNDAIGTHTDVLFSEVEASGDQDELDIRLSAAGAVTHPTLTDTVHARLTAAGLLLADVVELESLTLAAGPGDGSVAPQVRAAGEALELHAGGSLAISPEAELRLILDGRVDAGEVIPLVAAAAAVPASSGLLDVSGSLEGSWTDLEWTTVVTSPSVTVAEISAGTVALHAAGTADTITIDHLAFDALSGSAEARGSVVLAGAAPVLRGSGRATGVDIGALPGTPVRGAVDVTFEADMAAGDLASLVAVVDAEGHGLIVRPDSGPETAIGDARVHADAGGGTFSGFLAARDATAVFSGGLTTTGVESLSAVAEIDDLATTLSGIVTADIEGSLRAVVESAAPMDGLVLTARAEGESLAFGPVSIGTASVTAAGDPDDLAGRFSMFEGDASGTWALAHGAFAIDAMLDSLAIAGDFAVSPTRSVELDGSTTGRVAFATLPDGGFDLTAELAALSLASAGESIHLTAPAVIEASRDSVRVRGLEFAGTPGVAGIDGVFSPSGWTHVSASLESLRLDSVLAVAGTGPAGPDIRGIVHGSGDLAMRDGSIELDATLVADGLVADGVRIGDIAIDAESDDADLIFELVSTSEAGGRITALGSLPYASDTTSVFSLETDREFAATVLCSSYVFEAGPAFLPQVRGRKLFTLSGSALVTGRADSLGSVNGAGRFEGLEAAWGFVSFALTDPFGFFIHGGAVEMDELSVAVRRQRALGMEDGGRINISGSVDADGRLALAANTTDLDVAHVARAFIPGAQPPVTGLLKADAVVGGTVTAPRLTFSWDLMEPTLVGMQFDGLSGSGAADPYVLELTGASLTLGSSVMTASGVVPLQRAQGPAFHPGLHAGISEMDITVRADRFRIDRTQGLPAGVKRLTGVLDADVHLRGAPEAPDVEGVVSIDDARVDLETFENAIRDIEVRLSGSEGTATLETAFARIGSGTVSATGTMGTSDGGRGFRADVAIDAAEIAVKEIMDAQVSGTLVWAGVPSSSLLEGHLTIDEATVTYEAGLSDLLQRRPQVVVVPTTTGPLASVNLDVTADIVEPVSVESNLAEMELAGGVRAGGTLAEPSLSGGVSADGGSLWYLGQEFIVEQFSVLYTDPRRRVPSIDVAGTATVESTSGEEYVVTVRYQGFVGETVPELTSVPPLSEPDVVALLTFGETMGALTSGGSSGSAGESFGALARSAFVGGLFGVAETTARRWLRLDTVDLSGESLDAGSLDDAQVTLGKRFGRNLSVDYTTDLGGFSGQTVGLSWRLTDTMSVETKANQEGNHAIGLTFRFRFE